MGKKCFHNLRPADNRIWKYRHILNLSQEDIGRRLKYKTTAPISSWEKGRKIPNLVNAIRLSEILHTSVEALFPGLTIALKQELEAKGKLVALKSAH